MLFELCRTIRAEVGRIGGVGLRTRNLAFFIHSVFGGVIIDQLSNAIAAYGNLREVCTV